MLSAAEENKSCCLTAQPLRPACLLRLTRLCWCWLLPSRFRCLAVRSLAAGPQQYPWVPAGPQHFVTFLFVYFLLVLPHIPSFLVSSARAQGMVGATLSGVAFCEFSPCCVSVIGSVWSRWSERLFPLKKKNILLHGERQAEQRGRAAGPGQRGLVPRGGILPRQGSHSERTGGFVGVWGDGWPTELASFLRTTENGIYRIFTCANWWECV